MLCWTLGQKLQLSVKLCIIILKALYANFKPQHKPVLGANNMSLHVLGEVGITLQLSGVTAQHRVFVCRGLTQEILVGIDFLRTHKCVLNFDTGTVYTKEGPSKMVFGHLDKVCRITEAETITLFPNMVAANTGCDGRPWENSICNPEMAFTNSAG